MLQKDERGGYNAKSTVLALLETVMGSYATTQDPCIFYKSDKVRSINDHGAGLLHLEKKRLMIVEETDPSKVLSCSQKTPVLRLILYICVFAVFL